MQQLFSIENAMAIEILERIGVSNPTQGQIDLIELATTNVAINQQILFDKRLTKKEMMFLFFAARGKTLQETARMLNIKTSSVASYRRRIKKKLKVASLAQAVFEGMRFGYIHRNLSINQEK